jgi:hypothetical protein
MAQARRVAIRYLRQNNCPFCAKKMLGIIWKQVSGYIV